MVGALTAFERSIIQSVSARAGIAAKLLDAWGDHLSPTPQSSRSLASLAHLSVGDERAVDGVLNTLQRVGLLRSESAGFVPGTHSAELFRRLALALYAVDHYKAAVHRDVTAARVVLTKPARPCILGQHLSNLGWHAYNIDPTDHAFKRMVQMAMTRVVVMTPFFDAVGARWLQELLGEVPSGIEKVLILRSLEAPERPDYPHGFDSLASWLRQEQVQVFNYSVARVAGSGRETFHAKVLLCDEEVAYLGSSNVNAASLEHSMEMGVELNGKAARDISVVLEAVLRSSTRWL